MTSGVGLLASIGYGNYNALFVTLKSQDWHEVTMQSNFTWSKALGTGAEVQATSASTPPDPFNLGQVMAISHSIGALSITCSSSISLTGTSHSRACSGICWEAGHSLLSSPPAAVCRSPLARLMEAARVLAKATLELLWIRSFGERHTDCSHQPRAGLTSFVSGNGIGTSGLGGANMFADPAAAFNNIRQPILGYDTRDGGFGVFRGMPYWNVDLSVKKLFKITERFSVEAQVVFTNLFNHDQFGDPFGDYLDTSNPGGFGSLPGSVSNGALTYQRQMEFGIRLSF